MIIPDINKLSLLFQDFLTHKVPNALVPFGFSFWKHHVSRRKIYKPINVKVFGVLEF